MPIYNKIICVFLLVMGITINAQNTPKNNIETTQVKIDSILDSYKKNIANNNYYQALLDLELALNHANTIDNKKNIGFIYSKIGKLQHKIKETDKSINTLIKAIDIQRATNDIKNLAITYNIIGNVYADKKDYDQAIAYYESAETLFRQKSTPNLEAEVLLNKGKAQLENNAFEKAKKTLEKAIKIAKKKQLTPILSSSLIQLGKTLHKLNYLGKALENANDGYDIAKANGYSSTLLEGCMVLSDLHKSDGNLKLSNDYLRYHIKLSDSLAAVNQSAFSQKPIIIKPKKTGVLKKEVQPTTQKKESNTFNQLTTILSIALITILSLLTLSLYKNNNIRLKSNNVLHKKNAELIVAKEKAELASRTKANFLSTVTHELRTPLYAVTGLTNMLLDENPKPEQIQHLKSLKFSGDYLLTFINDILQINKIEANKVDIEPETFNLKKKITNVISALNNSALDNNIKIHLEYDKTLPLNYNADQLKISQILINLIGNSIKFTKDGDIWIRANKIGEKNGIYNIRFEVEDNGIGIGKEKQEHLFESFSQGSIQINRKYGGTGLGLSIVKGLIDILKGKIYLKSELGKGSTFIFELPMQYTDEVVKEKKINYFNDVNDLDLSNIKILVVEDNKINQMITKKILNKMNLNCDVVDNGEEAVDRVKTTDYNVVLMDIHMPGISGIEATKIIRTFDQELTIFALTAVTIEDKMQEFEDAGFNNIISKPFKQEDFERKLFNALIPDED
ncbi:ATP-binding protein [Pontimicrobium sp. MEBiC01747]